MILDFCGMPKKNHEWSARVMFFFPDIAKIEKTNPGLISGKTVWFRKTEIT